MANEVVNRRLNIHIDHASAEQEIKFKIRSLVMVTKPTVEGYDIDEYENARKAFMDAIDHLMHIGCEISIKKLNQ